MTPSAPIGRPAPWEYSPHHETYLSYVHESDLWPALVAQPDELRRALAGATGDGERLRYAEGKWSIRQVVGHLSDTERVFAHRAFSFARADPHPIPGFDENAYAERAGHDARPLAELLDEFAAVRSSGLHLLAGLSEAEWLLTGTANTHQISVRALGYLMVGHVRHHLRILVERYLTAI
jgi:uncharacterized damage-inducible protein DinB